MQGNLIVGVFAIKGVGKECLVSIADVVAVFIDAGGMARYFLSVCEGKDGLPRGIVYLIVLRKLLDGGIALDDLVVVVEELQKGSLF